MSENAGEIEKLLVKLKKRERKIHILEEMIESNSRKLYIKQNELNDLNSQMKRKREQLDKTVHSTVLISETNTDGVITYANNKFCKTSQYNQSELIGKDHKIINSGEHSKEFWANCWNTIKAGNIWNGVVCNKAKDGSLYWVESTILPVLDKDQNISSFFAIRIDITSKKQAEDELLIQTNKSIASSKLASLGELSAGVGHEINNPLMISVGNIRLVKKIIDSLNIKDEKLEKKIDKVQQGHDRIRLIVDGLRTYARSDESKNDLISLRLVIDQTVNLISEIYEKEGVLIIRETPDVEMFTLGNLGKIQQIIMNFISNAKDATEGQGSRKIYLSLEKFENTRVKLSVRDNGTGIPDEIKDKILDPFFTTKEVGKGTGMGLGLVSEFIKAMDGELLIESEMGKGSQFCVVLPIAEPPKSPAL